MSTSLADIQEGSRASRNCIHWFRSRHTFLFQSCFGTLDTLSSGLGANIVVSAEGESSVVSPAAVPSEGEHNVLIFIIAYPLATAFSLGQILGLST